MPLSLALRDAERNLFFIQKILKEMCITGITINTGKKNPALASGLQNSQQSLYRHVVNRHYHYFFIEKFKKSILTVPRQ